MLDLGIGCVCPLRNQNGMKMLRTFQKTATRLCLSLAPGHQLVSVRRALGSRSQSTNSASESRGYSSIFIPSCPHCYLIQAYFLIRRGWVPMLDAQGLRYFWPVRRQFADEVLRGLYDGAWTKTRDYLDNIVVFFDTSSLLFVAIFFLHIIHLLLLCPSL